MTQVTVKNGNLDMALRKFKQKVARDGVPSECKKRECYDKPGVRRTAGSKNSKSTTKTTVTGIITEEPKINLSQNRDRD